MNSSADPYSNTIARRCSRGFRFFQKRTTRRILKYIKSLCDHKTNKYLRTRQDYFLKLFSNKHVYSLYTKLMPSVFDYKVNDNRGNTYALEQHRGEVLLIMNIASKCGYTTSGYNTANILYQKYKNQKFKVLAFPCNQFGSQEPGSNSQIQDFACNVQKAEFPILSKINVNGGDADPLWLMLQKEIPGILGTTSIKWNFTKFLCDREGFPRFRYSPGDGEEKIEKDLVSLL